MSVHIQTLEKLERKITLTLPIETIKNEVDSRLRKLARQVRMDGFRPGKVPLAVVAQRYGYSVHYEVVNDKVGEAFQQAANEARLRVAGQPTITEAESAPEGQVAFDAVFEVFPDVKLPELSELEIERLTTQVTPEAIERTVDILRRQRRTFSQRAQDAQAQAGDRVTVDFEGKIDGEAFDGGSAKDFQFIVGEGRMLQAFEQAVQGMRAGESKTFPLAFPQDYPSAEVAGKTADFLVSLRRIEASHLPEVNEAFIRSLGIAEPTVDALHADIRANLEREVRFRLLSRNKQAVLDALATKSELDLPKASVAAEIERLTENARAELRQRGIKDADKAPIPEELVRPQAERRVRLGLVVAEMVRRHQLQATPEQLSAQVEELSASYEKPAEVRRWYYSDNRRMAEVEAVVIERNVTEFVLAGAKVVDKAIAFDELMSAADSRQGG